MMKEAQNERMPQGATRVYHGKAQGQRICGGKPMNPRGFYVTAERSLAEMFGDVHSIVIWVKSLRPDPEIEGFEARRLSGAESLGLGSAILPHRYYQYLTRKE